MPNLHLSKMYSRILLAVLTFRLASPTSNHTVAAPTCPDPHDIYPCVCLASLSAGTIDLDCNMVEDEIELANVFTATFPDTNLGTLYIRDNPNIKVLREGVFGPVTFQEIEVTFSGLEEVEERAMAGSYHTLEKLRLYCDNLSAFPFHTLHDFTALKELEFFNNSLDEVPVLESSTLTFVDLGINALGSLPVTAVRGLPAVERFHFDNADISEIVPGTFGGLEHLWKIYLAGNHLEQLVEGAIQLGTTRMAGGAIYLYNNGLSTIEPGAITGLRGTRRAGYLFLRNNSLTLVEEAVFRPLFEDVTYIDLAVNPLACECDMAWLVTNDTLMTRLEPLTTCYDGKLVANLDPNYFHENCPHY